MSLFGSRTPAFGTTTTSTTDVKQASVEITGAPDDTVQALQFNPQPNVNLLASGSWDNLLRVWEVKQDGTSQGKAEQTLQGPVLDIDWSADGKQLFAACADKSVRAWDLQSNQMLPIGQHDNTVNTVHYTPISGAPMLMTTGWDKTIKFWDLRQNPTGTPALNVPLTERVFAADVCGPMAVFALADRHVKIFKLDGNPQELKDIESPLKFQSRAISIFKNKSTGQPMGFAIGSVEGRVAIQYVETNNPKDNFTFKCHRSTELSNGYQEIYAVNDIKFHPIHGTLVTAGGDGRYSFWDKDARTKLKTSDLMQQQITSCAFNPEGTMMAYAVGYDWSKGHEYNNPNVKPKLFIYPCFQDMQPRLKK